MIFKCEHCNHLLEIEDPATGWEDTLDPGTCPACSSRLRSPVKYVKLLQALVVGKFLAVVFLTTNLLLNFGSPTDLYVMLLIVTSAGLFFLDNRKGKPIMLRQRSD